MPNHSSHEKRLSIMQIDLRRLTKTDKPIIGTFSKGIDGSISVNFGLSGGKYCDTDCAMHPKNRQKSGCYAARAEIRPDRQQLADKLRRHENMPPVLVAARALLELQTAIGRGLRVPWLRLSTNGPLPPPELADSLFRYWLRELVAYAVREGIPVHVPVESYAKARFYRSIIGDLVVVRETAQNPLRFVRARGAVSVVAGSDDQSRAERIDVARQLARRRRNSGRKVIVCPAITNSFAARSGRLPANPRAKCGACTACAEPNVDIVYPLH